MYEESLENTLEKVGRILADRYGIKVVCRGQSCYTDGKTINLPALPPEVPRELRSVIRAYLDHEVAHIAGESDMDLAGKFTKDYGEEAFGLFNTLEDLRVEKFITEIYAGCGVNLSKGFEYASEKLAENADKLSSMKQLTSAVFYRGKNKEIPEFIPDWASEAAYSIDDLIKASKEAADTKEAYNLSVKAWEKVKDCIPEEDNDEEENQQSENSSSSDNTKEERDSDSEGSGEGDSNSKADSDPDNNTNASEDDKDSRDSNAKALSHGNPMSDLSGIIEDSLQNSSEERKYYRIWNTGYDCIEKAPLDSKYPHSKVIEGLSSCISGVRQHLLQSLKAESFSKWLPDCDRGSINPKSLHRLINGSSSLVFRKKVKGEVKSTAVSMLVDLSASMDGEKLELARKSSLIFCEALANLDIPASVIGFTTSNNLELAEEAEKDTGKQATDLIKDFRLSPLSITIFKDFNEKFSNISSRFAKMHTGNFTPLGEALLISASKLKRRPEERKIILCLTDGQPVVGLLNERLSYNHAIYAISLIEKADIEVVLIGIKEPFVEKLHKRHVIVNNLQELPATVIRQLRQTLQVACRH